MDPGLENRIRQTPHFPDYPPQLSRDHLFALHDYIKDWQITHGSLIKLPRTDEGGTHSVHSRPIGVSMFPTPFPRKCFADAVALQQVYNELYAAIANDEEWLREVLRDLIEHDKFTGKLWAIYETVKSIGYCQPVSLGVFRSDYMLNVTEDAESRQELRLKQVEFQSFACAGGSHANIVSNMHAHLIKNSISIPPDGPAVLTQLLRLENVPENRTVKSIVEGLAAADEAYQPWKQVKDGTTAVLFVVQPKNVNICDERPVDYGLKNLEKSVPTHRVFWHEVLDFCSLGPSRELLYTPPFAPKTSIEISVVYLRAGIDTTEYEEDGIETRLLLEKSRAIKCPSILTHLASFKKVQQALAIPGTLTRFIDPEKAALVESTFAPLHPMDNSKRGLLAKKLAINPDTAINHVLKPSLEGGGHNIYGHDIPEFLAGIDQKLWGNYILMELIQSPYIENVLLTTRELYSGPVISELGIFGTAIWETTENKPKIMRNVNAGWSMKTKAAEVNEMSVVKGYGCFDCPVLLDEI